MTFDEMVKIWDRRLPAFKNTISIQEYKALVFDPPCEYDIIFSSDFLSKVEIKIGYEESMMEWVDANYR